MGKISGGVMAARMLKAAGVDTFFSLVGGHVYTLYDACIEEGIRIIDVRHEQAAAHMAEGYALATGKPGVCVVTAGPGFTNALSGVANASLGNTPMILLSGHSPLREFDTGALQDLNQIDIIRPITKMARSVYETKRIPEYMAMAFRHVMAGRPGPVYLEIPQDIFFDAVEESDIQWPKDYLATARPSGDPEQIEKALVLLDSAERPVVVAGSGVWWSQAHGALKDFVEKSGIPVFTRNHGRGAVPDDHPLCFGPGGLSGLFKADVALIVGTQFDYTFAYGKFPPELKIIRVDIDASVIGHNRGVEVGIVGDAKRVLEQLTSGIHPGGHDGWIGRLRDGKKKRVERVSPILESDKTPIHPLRLCHELSRFIDKDTVVSIDGGDIAVFGVMTLPTYGPGQQLSIGSSTFGCLGVGIPYALAAKLARPEKRVMVLVGDGSFGMNAMEFDTALRHELPFVCVISNDGCWGMIKHNQGRRFGADRIIGCDLPVRRYDRLVESLGGHGEFVERADEIAPAIERALASGRPACVNVVTDQTATPRDI